MTDAAPPPKVSIWEDFLEIFYAPSRVFARRGADWGIPLLVLIVLTAILTFATMDLFRPLVDADAARNLARLSGKLTPEQIEQQRAIGEKIAGLGPYLYILVSGIAPMILGIFLWLVGKVLGAVESLGEALMIAVFSYFPRLVGSVVAALQAALLPEEKLNGLAAVSLGPARFMDPDTTSTATLAWAGRLELSIIWATLLLAIGLKVKGRVSTTQALIAAFVLWLLGSLVTVAPAMMSGG